MVGAPRHAQRKGEERRGEERREKAGRGRRGRADRQLDGVERRGWVGGWPGSRAGAVSRAG